MNIESELTQAIADFTEVHANFAAEVAAGTTTAQTLQKYQDLLTELQTELVDLSDQLAVAPSSTFVPTFLGTLDMIEVTELLGKTSISVQDGIVVVSGQTVEVTIEAED